MCPQVRLLRQPAVPKNTESAAPGVSAPAERVLRQIALPHCKEPVVSRRAGPTKHRRVPCAADAISVNAAASSPRSGLATAPLNPLAAAANRSQWSGMPSRSAGSSSGDPLASAARAV
jgi:hypothetical protein